MKKILLLLTALVLVSIAACTPDDDNLQFHIEFLPVESVSIPSTVARGYTYPITVTYNKPTDCHYFDGFSYEADGTVRVVAVQSIVIEDASCAPLDNVAPEEESFNFYCAPNYYGDTYTFKFYKGEDAQGNILFEEHTVEIAE